MKKGLLFTAVAAMVASTSVAQMRHLELDAPVAAKAIKNIENVAVKTPAQVNGVLTNINTIKSYNAMNDLTKGVSTLLTPSYSYPEHRQLFKEVAFMSDNYNQNAREISFSDGSTYELIPSIMAPVDSTLWFIGACTGDVMGFSWQTYVLDYALESQDAEFAYPESGYFYTPTMYAIDANMDSAYYNANTIIRVGGSDYDTSDAFEVSSSDHSSLGETYYYYGIAYNDDAYGVPFGANTFDYETYTTSGTLPTFGNWFVSPYWTAATLYGASIYLDPTVVATDADQMITIGLYESGYEQASILRGTKLGEITAKVSDILDGTAANATLVPGSEATGIAYWNEDGTVAEEVFSILTFTLDEAIILEYGEVCIVIEDFPANYAAGDRFSLITDPYAAASLGAAYGYWYDYTSWGYAEATDGNFYWFDISSSDYGFGFASSLGVDNIILFMNPIMELNADKIIPAGIEQATADAAVACKASVNGDIVTLAYEDASMALVYNVDGALISTTPLKGTGTSTLNIAGNGVYLIKVIAINGTSQVVKVAK